MRRALVVSMLACAAISQADRLITIPTARKIPFGIFRYEVEYDPTDVSASESLLGIGISTAFDLELRSNQQSEQRGTGTFDFSYSYVAALTGLSPGISFGVQDAANQTPDGRRLFGVSTFRVPSFTMDGDYPADITLGVFVAKKSTPFVGVEIPFCKAVHFLAEHNGERISTGLEGRPISWLNLRAEEIGKRTFFSGQITSRF